MDLNAASGGRGEKFMAKKTGGSKAGYKAHWGVRILIVLLIGVILGVSLLFENKINAALGLTKVNETEYDGTDASDIIQQTVGDDLNVHFVDVGQGDACIIELPDDKNVIIDGGEKDARDAILSYIEENIKDDDGKTISYFDYAILTHTDSDHCGSLDDVLNAYPAEVFYRPNVLCTYNGFSDPDAALLTPDCAEKSTKAYMEVLAAADKSDPEVRINSWELAPIEPDGLEPGDAGYYSITFYGPNSNAYKDWNNYSPIMILEYEGERIALTGDCEKEGEAEFAAKASKGEGKFAVFDDTYAVSVIKAGHHGSRTSTGKEFIEAVTTPQSVENTLIIISCGADNKYKHPHQEKLEEFKELGFKDENILRTDQNGSIVLSVRLDEATGQMRLFYGADPMVKTQETTIDWRYIALAIFVAAAMIILIEPAVKKAKSAGRKRSR